MKFVIVLACLLAIAYANEEAEVIKEENEVNPDSFKYFFELSNHIRARQEGHFKDKENWVVDGENDHITKDGKHVHTTYTADEYGYHPKVELSN